MPTVPIPVPSLTGGVSRQASTLRHANQVEDAINCMMSLTRGCEKRPGSEFIAGPGTYGDLPVTGPTSTKQFIHWIDRDTSQRYVVVIDDTQAGDDVIQVFDLNGVKKTVNYTVHGTWGDPKTYLSAGSGIDSRDKMVAMTVADATFLINKEKVTALTATTEDYQFSGTPVRNSANAHHKDNWLGFDRPPTASGEYWYAAGDSVGNPAGFYRSINHTGPQPWYEKVRTEGAGSVLDASTMPVRMTYNSGTDEFTVAFIDWNFRHSGDGVTNPGPSFIGKKLGDIHFHRDRLFFSADEQVVGSQAGDYYNYWVENYAAVSDADPIDVALTGNSVNVIDFLVGFAKTLTIMTKGSRQFELKAPEALTPSTVNLSPTTSYASSSICRPKTLGNHLYFVADRGNFSQVYEYYLDEIIDQSLAVDVSAHVEGYIPAGVDRMVVSVSNDLLVLSSRQDRSKLWLYQAFWSGNQKSQSAWHRWEFDEGNEILSYEVFDNWLYLLIRRSNLVYLERIFLAIPDNDEDFNGTMPWSLRMDRKFPVLGSYDAPSDTTTWNLGYKDATITEVVLGGGWGSRIGRRITVVNDSTGSTTTLSIAGNYTLARVWTGRPYEMRVTLSPQYVRNENGLPVPGTLQLRQLIVWHKNTGFYEVLITPTGRQTQTKRFSAIRLGSLSSILGQINVAETGEMNVKVMASGSGTIIEIVNDTPLPTIITNLDFIGAFVPLRANIAK